MFKEAAASVRERRAAGASAIGNGCVIPAKAGIQWLGTDDTGFPLPRERRPARDPVVLDVAQRRRRPV